MNVAAFTLRGTMCLCTFVHPFLAILLFLTYSIFGLLILAFATLYYILLLIILVVFPCSILDTWASRIPINGLIIKMFVGVLTEANVYNYVLLMEREANWIYIAKIFDLTLLILLNIYAYCKNEFMIAGKNNDFKYYILFV